MTEEQRRDILTKAVRLFSNRQWFRDAVVYDKHPEIGEPTIEFKVNYNPMFERKDLIEFALSHNLREKVTVIE